MESTTRLTEGDSGDTLNLFMVQFFSNDPFMRAKVHSLFKMFHMFIHLICGTFNIKTSIPFGKLFQIERSIQ